MPPKPQPLVYQTCVLSKSLLVFEILWQSWLWVLSACCKLGMSHMVESINKSVWKFLGELTLLGWLHNTWSQTWWVLEEAASGWGASLAKGKELRSSWMTFRGGMVSACLRSAALWFGCSMFLSKAETFKERTGMQLYWLLPAILWLYHTSGVSPGQTSVVTGSCWAIACSCVPVASGELPVKQRDRIPYIIGTPDAVETTVLWWPTGDTFFCVKVTNKKDWSAN